MNKVSIIMYHYVRELQHSRYPKIKGLDLSLFKEQILFLKKHYNFISMEMLIDSIENNSVLPEKSVLLTFDDAYIDHFNYVFPFLDELNIQGSFFPPVKSILEHKVLDVNKIHFILAVEEDKDKIIDEIKLELKRFQEEYKLKSFSYYFNKLAQKARFDIPKVVFIKKLLQVELHEKLRTIITNNLFEKIIGINEESFSKELYMNVEQMKCMKRNNMHFGGHTYNHYWLGSLTKEKQRIEIKQSMSFLNNIGCNMDNWTMCYPYGSYNDSTIELMNEYNCKLALTTEVDVSIPNKKNKFKLPRLNTNDIPKDSASKTNNWFLKA